MIYRLINTQSGLAIGDYPTIEDAWAAVKLNKGRMVLWAMRETPAGWVWEQRPLRFIPLKDRLTFQAKNWLRSLFNKGDKRNARTR